MMMMIIIMAKWRHSTQRSATYRLVNVHTAYAVRLCNIVRQFLIY